MNGSVTEWVFWVQCAAHREVWTGGLDGYLAGSVSVSVNSLTHTHKLSRLPELAVHGLSGLVAPFNNQEWDKKSKTKKRSKC